MLLYEEGSLFKAHRDTEKAPGMFATLVVMLPSEHEGGDVLVQLGNRKKTLKASESNEFHCSFLAWRDDAEDETEHEWSLTSLFALEGYLVARNINIERGDIVQAEMFDDGAPDDEEEDDEGWTGNEGGTVTQFYRRTCLVLVPGQRLSKFFCDATSVEFKDWTQALLCRIDNHDNAKRAEHKLLKIVSLVTGS
ncbi:MAG: hypothetical protein Q9218_007009 [Villophora microphyllina]